MGQSSGVRHPPPAMVKIAMDPRYAPCLMWECVKKNHAFMRKSPDCPTFSAEKHNLTGEHKMKVSGFASRWKLDVVVNKKGVKQSIAIVKSQPRPGRLRFPKRLTSQIGLKKHEAKGLAKLEHEIMSQYYRRDLFALAKLKYQKIKNSFKTRKLAVYTGEYRHKKK